MMDAAKPEPLNEFDLIELLRTLKARGLTFSQVVRVYAEDNTPRQQKLVEKARNHYEREGELEFDDHVMASGSSDRGDYVMAWRWVYDDATTVTWRAAVTPEAWVATRPSKSTPLASGSGTLPRSCSRIGRTTSRS